jgi:hypothetical protein
MWHCILLVALARCSYPDYPVAEVVDFRLHYQKGLMMRYVNEVWPCGADGKLYPLSKLIFLDGNEDHRRTDGLKVSEVV